MSAAPLVALPTYHANAEGRVNLPAEYHEAVRRAGGRPVLIPPGDPDYAALLDDVDAVVLTGGGDIDPTLIGGREHPEIYGTSTLRDESELDLVRQIMDRRTPTLAICRGMQLLNVVLGGTLLPHLPDDVGDEVVHRADPPGPIPHGVRLDGQSLLAEVMGATEVVTASWHHQAIDELGDGLRPVAWADDGVIEAVELEGHPFLEVVQWHPEITAGDDPTQQALFDALVDRARRPT